MDKKTITIKKKIEKEDEIYTDELHRKQIEDLNVLYLNEIKREQIPYIEMIKKIKKKCQHYKQQDIQKKRILSSQFMISLELCLELLVESKLNCSYCLKPVFIEYYHERYPYQWTLDRIDNNKPHIISNLVISCLKCNLQKRRQCDSHFRLVKQMRIRKIE